MPVSNAPVSKANTNLTVDTAEEHEEQYDSSEEFDEERFYEGDEFWEDDPQREREQRKLVVDARGGIEKFNTEAVIDASEGELVRRYDHGCLDGEEWFMGPKKEEEAKAVQSFDPPTNAACLDMIHYRDVQRIDGKLVVHLKSGLAPLLVDRDSKEYRRGGQYSGVIPNNNPPVDILICNVNKCTSCHSKSSRSSSTTGGTHFVHGSVTRRSIGVDDIYECVPDPKSCSRYIPAERENHRFVFKDATKGVFAVYMDVCVKESCKVSTPPKGKKGPKHMANAPAQTTGEPQAEKVPTPSLAGRYINGDSAFLGSLVGGCNIATKRGALESQAQSASKGLANKKAKQ